MISAVPGYISRSVAGSYDNEGIAIFCMMLTYTLWIKSVKTGSIFWSVMCSLAYFYMVSSWGGYVFLINLIPLHVLVIMITGRFSHKIYVAYTTVYCLGTLLSMQIPFVGFQPVETSEHMAAFGVFGLCQIVAFVEYLRAKLSHADFFYLVKCFLVVSVGGAVAAATILQLLGKVGHITSSMGSDLISINCYVNQELYKFRLHHGLEDSILYWTLAMPRTIFPSLHLFLSISLLPGLLSTLICICSLSCFQVSVILKSWPVTWSVLVYFLFSVGMYYCFTKLTEQNIFVIMYGITSIYFAVSIVLSFAVSH